MSAPILTLRDDFADNLTAAAWTAAATGSATVAETSGQARFTLPSSTAGTHIARYTSSTTYDLTAGSFYINIGTMVATGVAAQAFFQLYSDNNNLQWIQISGTLTARTIIAGVTTTVYSVAWNATTYRYLRIRELSGNIQFDSSTDGVSWTNRAAPVTPFAITDLLVDFGASCGNIASPGSLRLDDANLILPALATTWRWVQEAWPLTERNKTTTIAIDTAGTAQGFLTTADGIDVSGDPSGNIRYWSGPANGGRVLTEQASLAAAQAMAVDLPLDGRFDLPALIEARCYRLNLRSIDGSSFVLREAYARRLVQADDIEAESIRALHIAVASLTGDRIVAGTITADLISVVNLEAVSAQMGDLHMDGVIDIESTGGIYQGTGTFAAPTTGLKIYNSGGVGRLAGYSGTVEQVAIDTDGKLKAAGGTIVLDANGIAIAAPATGADLESYKFTSGGVAISRVSGWLSAGVNALDLTAKSVAGKASSVALSASSPTTKASSMTLFASSAGVGPVITLAALDSPAQADVTIDATGVYVTGGLSIGTFTAAGADTLLVDGGINVGTATGAAAGQVRGSGYLMSSGVGALPSSAVTVLGWDGANTRGFISALNTGTYQPLHIEASDLRLKYQTTLRLQINSTGMGLFGVAPVARPNITGVSSGTPTAAQQAAVIRAILLAGANLGAWTDSTT